MTNLFCQKINQQIATPQKGVKNVVKCGWPCINEYMEIKNDWHQILNLNISEFFMSIRSINRKISCAFVSLVMHKGYWCHSGHYYSEVLDFNTGIWVCYDDDRLSQNNYFPEGVYIIEVWKIYLKTQGSKNVLLIIYIRIIYL